MRKKNEVNLAEAIFGFQRKIMKSKPTLQRMYDEIRMMQFRVRPLQGDISQLDFRNREFIEVLWNLGKLDEFFQKEEKNFSKKQKEVFMDFFDRLYDKFQTQLNKIELRSKKEDSPSQIIEMEIYKEDPMKKKLN